jgi:3-hydroxyisobutyrate dehydrogenase-like beta-hydroxyacid dehydrogenase
MERKIACIGFGEAASAFASDWAAPMRSVRAYDRKTDVAGTRDARLRDYTHYGVEGRDDPAQALTGASIVLSLVTADQALAAAKAGAPHLARGAIWFDMNSVAPDTKREAALAIEGAGGHYVDVAVMAPVHPLRASVPLLVAGPHADEGAGMLREIGFRNVRRVPGAVGGASAIKMIRSVMVKGLEALSAECVLAAETAGVRDAVLASLDASWPGIDWAEKADYNLDRMMVHGRRRAAEMEEVVKTLDALGTGSSMSRAIVERQSEIGALSIDPPDGLTAKLQAIASAGQTHNKGERAA